MYRTESGLDRHVSSLQGQIYELSGWLFLCEIVLETTENRSSPRRCHWHGGPRGHHDGIIHFACFYCTVHVCVVLRSFGTEVHRIFL